MSAADSSIQVCSFCNKHKDNVDKLIVSQSVAICNECVTFCQELLSDEPADAPKSSTQELDPRTIKQYLDQYVIGQDRAKRVLSVAIVNHYKRLNSKDRVITKSNVLMIGPTVWMYRLL
jgi:ATP-dependent Clp protease ATP-binding subunit ClpX